MGKHEFHASLPIPDEVPSEGREAWLRGFGQRLTERWRAELGRDWPGILVVSDADEPDADDRRVDLTLTARQGLHLGATLDLGWSRGMNSARLELSGRTPVEGWLPALDVVLALGVGVSLAHLLGEFHFLPEGGALRLVAVLVGAGLWALLGPELREGRKQDRAALLAAAHRVTLSELGDRVVPRPDDD